MKYRCKESFEIDCGSTWERDDETDIIGGEVHLDNPETMEWLEISEKDLEEYFEPLT